MKEYRIQLKGCDGKTEFSLELSKEELMVLEKIAEMSKEKSTYGCQPVLDIQEVNPHA